MKLKYKPLTANMKGDEDERHRLFVFIWGGGLWYHS